MMYPNRQQRECGPPAAPTFYSLVHYRFGGGPCNLFDTNLGCEKWLKDRKGRRLTYDDIEHYKQVVAALARTIDLMAEVDARTPSWPIT